MGHFPCGLAAHDNPCLHIHRSHNLNDRDVTQVQVNTLGSKLKKDGLFQPFLLSMHPGAFLRIAGNISDIFSNLPRTSDPSLSIVFVCFLF